MKKISLLALLSCIAFTAGFSSESEITELEKELLSLEHEFFDSSEELSSSSTEDTFSADPSISVILETSDTPPFITEMLISEETEKEVPVEIPPSYPHEEKMQTLDQSVQISFYQVFSSAPFIYSLLIGMSFVSITLCLYIILRIKQQTAICEESAKEFSSKFSNGKQDELSAFYNNRSDWLSKIVREGIQSKKYGLNTVLENMKSEGKQATLSSWQQLGILQDIAVISPMVGLLGTVTGLFYAFYDLNRSVNGLSGLLDGLGISVGTTVAGISVAVLSLVLHSMTKFKLVRSLAKIEARAHSIAYLIDRNDS